MINYINATRRSCYRAAVLILLFSLGVAKAHTPSQDGNVITSETELHSRELKHVLVEIAKQKTLEINTNFVGKVLGIAPSKFTHIIPEEPDDLGGDLIGPEQGGPAYIVLPYVSAKSNYQGFRLFLSRDTVVTKDTRLLACVDALALRGDLIAAGWKYLNISSDLGGLPWTKAIVARFERQIDGHKELVHYFYFPSSLSDYTRGCIYRFEIIPDASDSYPE